MDVFYKNGGVHLSGRGAQITTWSREIKNLWLYPDIRVVFSASSLLQILNGDADLSRRCVAYDMQDLSFREFLHFYKKIEVPVYTLQQLLDSPAEACDAVQSVPSIALFQWIFAIWLLPLLSAWPHGLLYGDRAGHQSGGGVGADAVVRVDGKRAQGKSRWLAYWPLRCLWGGCVENSHGHWDTPEYGNQLFGGYGAADILGLLYSDFAIGEADAETGQDISWECQSAVCMATRPVNIGTARETFGESAEVSAHSEYVKTQGDFKVDGKYIFEVGGADKTYKQIADLPHSYVLTRWHGGSLRP